MSIKTQYVTAPRIPARALARVRREAVRLGHRDSNSSAVRYAVLALAAQLWERDRNSNGST